MKEKYLSKLGKQLSIEIPEDWERVIQILTSKETRSLLVGPMDSGKSTFANLLLQRLSHRSLIMEVDPGQPTHGVPGTFNLVDKSGRRVCQYFFGELSPAKNPADVLIGINVLSRRVQGGGLVIDTSGFVSGELAVRLKLAKAILSKCDVAVIFESNTYDFQKFEYIFGAVGMSVFKVRTPNSVRKFSQEERRRRRELIFKKFFENAQEFEAEFGFEQVFGVEDFSVESLYNRYFALEDRKLVCEAVGLVKQAELQSSKLHIKGIIVGKPFKYTHIKISTLKLDLKV